MITFTNKLFSVLQTLSKVERNRFRKYLLSPYLNDQPDLLPLFDLADKALREGASLDSAQVWQKLYPSKQYQDATFRRLSSDLNQMALRFLSAEARSQHPLAEALDLQRLLEKPELKKHLAGIERNITRLLEEVPGQSSEFYLAQFNLHNNIVNRASKHLSVSGYAEKLSAADFYLECFYLTQKLELYIGWLLYQGSRVSEKSLVLPEGFWNQVQTAQFQTVPLLSVYAQVVNCLHEPEVESHFKICSKVLNFNPKTSATPTFENAISLPKTTARSRSIRANGNTTGRCSKFLKKSFKKAFSWKRKVSLKAFLKTS